MPVFSYVALPRLGEKRKLLVELNAFDYCEATPAENEEVLILVTDSPDQDSEKKLQQHLKSLQSLESLHMTFGCNEELLQGEGHEA